MDHIAGLAPTGRKLLGPASDLMELEAENGLRHTAIVFHPEYRTHPGITDALEVVRGFLESPLVTGLVELTGHDSEQGAFIYPTGSVWSVAEIIQVLSDLGEPAGLRAGLELMYTAGQILVEGADAGSAAGVYSHGGLTPRRIMVKRDGQVMVIGYALPQVEILQFHESGEQLPREDSFRYCPPERLEARPEDLTSDLFSLALIGFELMTGKPVYDGLVNDIRQQAARGEGSRRLFRFREVVDERVRDVLNQMLRPGPEARFADGDDFLDAIHGLLSQRRVEGLSLIELMDKVDGAGQRKGQRMETGQTVMVDKGDLSSGVDASEGEVSAEGRRPDRSWTPGRRRSVRRRRADKDQAIRASATQDPEAPPPTLVEVEESLTTSSASPAVEPAPPPSSHRWSKVQRPAGRRRAPRSRAPEPISEPVPTPDAPGVPPPPAVPGLSEDPQPDSSGADATNAAALLARIRGVAKPPEAPPPEAPPPEAPPQERAVPAPSRVDDAATVMMSRDQLRDTVASALDGTEGVTVLDTVQANDGQPLVPTVSLEHAGGGGLVPCRVAPPGGGEAVDVHLPSSATAAEAVAWMVGSVVPLPVDMSGRITGWYRLKLDDQRLAPDALISSVSAGQELALDFVPSETMSAQIEVVQGDATVRFMSPIGTAVPVASVVAHLRGWLGLPEGRWRLYRAGALLPGHGILDDGGTQGALELVLRRDDG